MRRAAIGIAAFGLGLAAALLRRAERRDPAAQAELERAVAAVDRELAANLELTTMFDQTRQAVTLENGAFLLHAATLAREVPAVHATANGLYARMPEAEAAMERRGPVNTMRDEDRAVVEGWEGDARQTQRALRAALLASPPSRWDRLLARVRDARGDTPR